MAANGEHGGKVLRNVQLSGEKLPPGFIITPEMAMAWPEQNRRALASSGKVMWFQPALGSLETSGPQSEVRRYKVNNGPGRFLVLQGFLVTEEPVDKETADRLVSEFNQDH